MLTLFFLIIGWITVQGQSQLEVPGDNFSLEGALEMFKKSATPEEFEKLLNNANAKVNNLDLNGDGYIDYIRVIDIKEGNVHAFILQAIISERESQDIAVITLEKLSNGKAVLQITGDEDIYGVETIIEPTREIRTYAGTTSSRAVVNVWGWPSVRYVYGPYYSAWISPWGWSYRPIWWYTRRQVAYHNYYPYWHAYRPYYSVCYTHRVVYAHQIYRPYRTTSEIVYNKHNKQIKHYRSSRSDYNSRARNDSYSSSSRQAKSSVRYDANGRISSNSDHRVSSRSSSDTRTQARSNVDNGRSSIRQDSHSASSRSATDLRVGTNSTQQNASRLRRSEPSENWSGSGNSNGTPRRERTTISSDRNGSSGRANTQRYEKGSSAAQSNTQSYSGSSRSSQRSSAGTNVQRSSGSSNVQRSVGGSNARQSSGNSNVSQSSRNSKVQRSSGTSNVRQSSGNSKVQRSTGSKNTRQSSGSTNERKRGRQ